MLKFIIIIIVALLFTFLTHKLTEKNIGFSMLIFLMSFALGIIILQPNGFERAHESYEWDSRPQNSVVLPCDHSDNLSHNTWYEASVYYDNITFLTLPEDTPVLIYCPRDYNVDSARDYYRKHRKTLNSQQ